MVAHIQDIVEVSPETREQVSGVGGMVTTKVTIGIATTPTTTIYGPPFNQFLTTIVADARWSDFGRLQPQQMSPLVVTMLLNTAPITLIGINWA